MALPSSVIFIPKSRVPEYLHRSDFYLSLYTLDESEVRRSPNDDQMITVPEDCLKSDTNIRNEDDLRYLLVTLRFWVATVIPLELIQFALDKSKAAVFGAVVPDFVHDLP
jgi:hypothetical protein